MVKTKQTPSVNTILKLGYTHTNKKAKGQGIYSHNCLGEQTENAGNRKRK